MTGRQGVTVLISSAVLVSMLGGAVMVRWTAPGTGRAASAAVGEAGLYPDGTALRRVGAKMILR
jgi:hypothetical protein